jgi:DNA-binding SARP family transcriptional activator
LCFAGLLIRRFRVRVPGDPPFRERFAQELLPEWDDDWVVEERFQLNQLRLHALETFAKRLIDEGRYGRALEAALTAMRDQPLRESAHRLVIRIHLLEGNQVEALLAYRRFRDLLRREVGVKPSERIEKVLEKTPL